MNPWDTTELMKAMIRAVYEMDPKERLLRRERNLQFVLNNTALVWAERFFVDLQVHARMRLRTTSERAQGLLADFAEHPK